MGDELLKIKRRYEWMLNEPQGAQHLLSLLKDKKGTKEDFSNMIDRIMASKEKANG